MLMPKNSVTGFDHRIPAPKYLRYFGNFSPLIYTSCIEGKTAKTYLFWDNLLYHYKSLAPLYGKKIEFKVLSFYFHLFIFLDLSCPFAGWFVGRSVGVMLHVHAHIGSRYHQKGISEEVNHLSLEEISYL